MRIGTILVVVWLVIGALAAVQRGYFSGSDNASCAKVSTIAVTIVAGPLNYVGLNPKVQNCPSPEPSK
ncbi:MAG TPA: hypothetical protein VFP89_02470 [Propionibacteriaceae bacterium]|nr:hypothetical protein [Propionibacteriaceae bacterium]